jgi:glycerol-3-phosphate acyltransferase PlsX
MSVVIALDVMGGDKAPEIVIEGADLALGRNPELRFLLFGDEARIGPLLAGRPALRQAAELHHTPDAVAADAKPSAALRQGRNSSMRLAIDAVQAGRAGAAVSAGNTGALMAMAMIVLKTLPGIDRPAIASVLPTKRTPVVFLDLGANSVCSAEMLFQFAVMGEVYARAVLGVAKPRVGLLNIGTEEVKGDGVVRSAAALVRDSGLPIDYVGFVEGTGVTAGTVDVVVTDGFTGNVALKIAEGTASMFTHSLRQAFASSLRAKLAYLLARPALHGLRDRFDPRLYNGAMFLGVNGVVVKSHGGTDAVGFAAAIRAALDLISRGTNERIIEEMGRVAIPDADEDDGDASEPQAATG